jgi:hypothetical protein
MVDGRFDLSAYPPAPVLWITNLLDSASPFDWRKALNIQNEWLLARVPSLRPSFPDLTGFQEFQQAPKQSSVSLFQTLYQYCFKTSSTALGDLTTPESCLVLLILVLLIRTLKAIFMPLFCRVGRHAARQTHGDEWTEQNPVRIAKFGEYVFRLMYHSFISLYGVVAFYDKEWWTTGQGGTRSLFQGFPYHPIDPHMAWYYLLQSAYNLDALVSLMEISFVLSRRAKQQPGRRRWLPQIQWSPDVRGDFKEMFIHHVVTNLLIVGSSFCRLTRIGSMVFLVHDLSDIPVDCSKLANFVKYKKTTIACFVIMVLVWMATRLYVLPFVIFYAALTESQYVLDQRLSPLLYICYRHFFYGLLAFLILLHVTWFGMFLRIFYTMCTKNEVHDYSEHKTGETDEKKRR